MLSPDDISQLGYDWDQDKLNQVAGLTGYSQPAPMPMVAQPDMRLASNDPIMSDPMAATMSDAAPVPQMIRQAQPLVLDPSQVPVQSAPAPIQEEAQYTPELSATNHSSNNTTVSSPGVSDSTRADAQASIAASGDIERQYIDTKTQALDGRLAINDAKSRALSQVDTDFQAEAESMRQMAAERVASAKKLSDDSIAEAGNSRPDPRRYFKNMSSGAKIQFAASMALGAFGAGMTGGENTAAKLAMQAIDDDMESQKLEYESGKSRMSASGRALEDAVKAYGDLPTAMKARKAEAESYAISRFREKEASVSSLEQKALVQKELAELLDKHAKTRVDLDRSMNASVTRTSGSSSGTTRRAGGDIGVKSVETLRKDTQSYGKALGEASIPTMQSAFRNLNTILAKVKDDEDVPGFGRLAGKMPTYLSGKEVTQARQSIALVQAFARKELSGQSLTESERKNFEGIVSGNSTGAAVRFGLDMIRNKTLAQKRNLQATYGSAAVRAYEMNEKATTGEFYDDALEGPTPVTPLK